MIINYNDVISRYRKHYISALALLGIAILAQYFLSKHFSQSQRSAFEHYYLAQQQVTLAHDINVTALAIVNNDDSRDLRKILIDQLQRQLTHYHSVHERLAVAASDFEDHTVYFNGSPSLDKAAKAQRDSAEQIALGLLVSERDIEVISNPEFNQTYQAKLEFTARYFEQKLNAKLAQRDRVQLVTLLVFFTVLVAQLFIFLKPFERVLNEVYKQLKKAWHDADKTNQIKSQFLHNLNQSLRSQTTAVSASIQQAIDKNDQPRVESYLVEALESAELLAQKTLHSIDASEVTFVHSNFNAQSFNLFDTVKTTLVKAKKLHQHKYSFRLAIANNAVAYFDKMVLCKIIYQLIELFPGSIEQVEASLCANRQFAITAIGKLHSGVIMQYQGEQFMQQSILHQQLVSFDGIFSITQQQEKLMITCELPLECDSLVLENTLSRHPSQILLVVNNPLLQHIVLAMLENMGHTVTLVASGESALAYISSNDAHLVISDAQLLDMSCVTLTKLLRSKYNFLQPICLLIDSNNNALRLDALDSGANCFINKPLNYKNIFEQIEKQMVREHEKSGR